MAKPTVDLLSEHGVIISSVAVVKDIWTQRFSDYKEGYDAANTSISSRLDDATKGQDKTVLTKTLISMTAKIVDIAAKPFGVYGMIASVALAGLTEIAKGAIHADVTIKLKAPSAATFSADLEKVAGRMFEPLDRKILDIANKANTQRTMDAGEFRSAKSLLLSSPIWYPPPELQAGLVARQIEEVLWCAYFAGLYQAGYASYQLGYLGPIVSYLMDEHFVSPGKSAGWERYPTPISQGGPGDWLDFVGKTHRIWTWKLDEHLDWLTPMPVIPENAKIQKSVNWTPPKAYTFAAPTQSGRATIRIESVEMTLSPSLDWSDVPALVQKQK